MLSILGKIYGTIIAARNALYDRGIFKSYDLGRRTISVGNLTTGGTGKTPLVALIAEILAENGERVCVLTRGFGRKNENECVLVSDGKQVLVDAETGGDEPVELAHKLIGKAFIVADADRVAAASWAKEQFEITVFILDDGFQHRRAKRDLDIICIDATNPFGNGGILPAGTLRESFAGLKRADAIVITRADQAENISELESRLKNRNDAIPIFKAVSTISQIVTLEEFHAKTQSMQRNSLNNAFVFCGIGNASNFFNSLKVTEVNIVGELSLNDHTKYESATLSKIESEARSVNASALVTTAKDAVKLQNVRFSLPCYVAIAETVVSDDVEFRKLITSS